MPEKKILYRLMSSADGEREFYGVMGKFFASAAVMRDLHGYPLNNDDSRMWIVAFSGERVVGFASFGVGKRDEGHLFDAWVDLGYRKRGIYARMLDLCMQWFIDHNISLVHVIAYPGMQERFNKLGFTLDNMRGKYAYMSGAPALMGDFE